MIPRVIGLCGQMEVGKTATAKAIAEQVLQARWFDGVTILPFAGPLKRVAREIFGWDGTKDEKGRRLLQVLGTDAGRAYNPDLWVNLWAREAADILAQGHLVLVDDVRFQNEVDAVVGLGGQVVRLTHPIRGLASTHPSENSSNLSVGWSLDCGISSPGRVASDILLNLSLEQER